MDQELTHDTVTVAAKVASVARRRVALAARASGHRSTTAAQSDVDVAVASRSLRLRELMMLRGAGATHRPSLLLLQRTVRTVVGRWQLLYTDNCPITMRL